MRLPAVIALCLCPLSDAELRWLSPDQIRQIDKAVSAAMSRSTIAGVSVAVAGKGGLYWAKGYGEADLENSVPVTPLTHVNPENPLPFVPGW